METLYDRPCVELSIGGRELKDMDFLSKSDPFVVLYLRDTDASVAGFEDNTRDMLRSTGSLQTSSGLLNLLAPSRAELLAANGWVLVGKTETIWDNLNPSFVTPFYFPYDTDVSKTIRLRAVFYDQDNENADLRKHDLIGSCEFDLRDVMKLGSHTAALANCKGKVDGKCGYAYFVAELARFDRAKQKLLDIGLLFSPDSEIPRGAHGPKAMFFVVSRCAKRPVQLEQGSPVDWVPVYRSGHTTPPMNPGREFKFQEFAIASERLYGNEESRKFKLELFIYNKKGNHLLAGFAVMSITELRREANENTFNMVIGDEKAGLVTGTIRVNTSFSRVPGAVSVLSVRCTHLAWKGKISSGGLLKRIGIR